jgi:hemerythrin-like metal-binding protein
MLDAVNLHHLLGVPIRQGIDHQHSEIKRKRKNLRIAIVQGIGMDQIIACANDLIETTLEHFKSEEEAMDGSKFQAVTAHKLLHAKMADTVKEIWTNLKRRKVGDAMELMKFFDENLTRHLEFEDGAYGRVLDSAELESKEKGLTWSACARFPAPSVAAVVGVVVEYGKRPVNLFGQHHPCQLMRQRDPSQ